MDGVIAALAERQHGVVARWQLLARGIGTEAIRHRLDRGRLYRVHHGVYAVGHRLLTREGWWMAAVLAAGPGAVLSHCSAAALWRIRSDSRSYIEVTSPRRVHGRAGIKAHRATLPPDEMTLLAGIPVTTVPRTLLDLAAVLPPHQTRRAMTEAEFLRLGDAVSLDDLVHRHRGERGTKPLRDILENARIGQYVTRSELEVRFLTLLDERNLPRPQTNVIVEGREVDCSGRPTA